jgi:hypothetical protein
MAKMNAKVVKRIQELVELLKGPYRTPEVLNQVLAYYLPAGNVKRGRFPLYKCNCHTDTHPSVSVNTSGTIRCGCFPCGIVCNNAIDICQQFGGISSFAEAVIEASQIVGLISHSEAMDLLEGKEITVITPKPKNVVKTTTTEMSYEKKTYDPIKADQILKLFSRLNELNGQPRLKKEHLEELLYKRKLTMKEIEEIGFFSYPTAPISLLLEEMEEIGLVEDDLKFIPPFFYNRRKKQWDYATMLKGNNYCIPHKDANENWIAIQNRNTEETPEEEKSDEKNVPRYTWAASNFAMYDEKSKQNLIYGNSPGAPISVIKPKKVTNATIFITEGFYKAYEFAKTFGCISLSVQGVSNIAGMLETLETLEKNGHPVKKIMIGFDADMAIKETVLKPALILGATLLEMPQEMRENGLLKILARGNKTEDQLVKNFKREAKEIYAFFSQSHKYEIHYVVWDLEHEKGIDDLIHVGKQKFLQHMFINEFWAKSFQVLKEIDNYRFEESKYNENNEDTPFSKIKIPNEILNNLFNNIVLTA